MSRNNAYIIAAVSAIAILFGGIAAACSPGPQYDAKCTTSAYPYIVLPDSSCDRNQLGATWRYANIADLDDDDLAIVGRPIDDDWLGRPDPFKKGHKRYVSTRTVTKTVKPTPTTSSSSSAKVTTTKKTTTKR